MLTIGDVLAVVGIVVAIGVSTWALIVAVALLFEERSKVAARLIRDNPWKTGFLGLIGQLLIGGLGFVLIANPLPGAKLAGSIVALTVIVVTAIGVAGLVGLAARRIRELDPDMSAYGALSRGSMFVVIPSVLPLIGWLLIGPVVLALGMGAGLRALRAPSPIAPPIPGVGAA